MYTLFTRNVHTFHRNVHEPGSCGSWPFSCLTERSGSNLPKPFWALIITVKGPKGSN